MFIALSQTAITALVCYIKKKLSETFPKTFSFPDINVWSRSTIHTVGIKYMFYSDLI